MSQERTDVVLGFYIVPIDVGVSTKNTHLMLAMAAHVRFAHPFIQVSVNWWWGPQTECVTPGPLHLLDRNCFACNVSIYRLLIERIPEFHHDVVNAIGEVWVSD